MIIVALSVVAEFTIHAVVHQVVLGAPAISVVSAHTVSTEATQLAKSSIAAITIACFLMLRY